MESLIILAGTFVVFWLLFIRPQQRRMREHQALVASIEAGDQVVTTAGLYGRITAVHDDIVRLEVAPGVEVRVARSAVGHRVTDETDAGTDHTADDDEPGAGPVAG